MQQHQNLHKRNELQKRPHVKSNILGRDTKRKPCAGDKAGTNLQLTFPTSETRGGERGASSTNETGMHKRNEAQPKLPGKYQKRSEHLTIHKILPGRELRLSAGPTCQFVSERSFLAADYLRTARTIKTDSRILIKANILHQLHKMLDFHLKVSEYDTKR